MLQAPQETIQVIRDSVDTMDDNDLAISEQMLRSILVARDNPNFATIDTTREELLELQEKVSKKIDASGVPKNPMQRYMTLAAMGKQEEAAKLVDQIIAEADPNDVAQLTTAMNLAIGRDKLDAALQLREKLRALRKQSATVQQDLNYALVFKLFTSKDHRAKAIEVLAESFEKPSSFTPGGYGAGAAAVQLAAVAQCADERHSLPYEGSVHAAGQHSSQPQPAVPAVEGKPGGDRCAIHQTRERAKLLRRSHKRRSGCNGSPAPRRKQPRRWRR